MIETLKNPGVYCFWHKASNKIYIGSAKNLAVRLKSHFKGQNSNAYLQKAITKYGLDAFNITQITTESHIEALYLEQMCLNYIFAKNLPRYNLSQSSVGGKTLLDYTEHSKLVSIARRARARPCFALDLNNSQEIYSFSCNIEASEKIGIDRSIISRSCRNNKPCNSKNSRWLFSNISKEHLIINLNKLTSAQIIGGRENFKGSENGFYGRKHTAATKAILSEKRRNRITAAID